MSEIQEAARRIAEREDNARRSAQGVQRIRAMVGELVASGRKLVYGGTHKMALDLGNSPSPDQAKETLDQMCKLAGVEPGDLKGLENAVNALVEATGLYGDAVDSSPPPAPQRDKAQTPKVTNGVDPKMVARGRRILGWSK